MSIAIALRVRDGSVVSFRFAGADYTVDDIEECWVVGHEVAFRVVADGRRFDLRGDPATLAWTLDKVADGVPNATEQRTAG
jgi:hypothetical protein